MGLNSTSVIKILDLLCEGPIDGIEGRRKGVYLDETPLKSVTGENNYDPNNISYQFNPGTRGQAMLPNIKDKAGSVTKEGPGEVGSDYEENNRKDKQTDEDLDIVKSRNYGAGTAVYQVTDSDVDSVDLLFTVPALFSTAQEGLVKGQQFDAVIFFDVRIADKSGKYKNIKKADVSKISEDFKTDGKGNLFYIEGISTTGYQYKISGIELEGEAPWTIQVRKYPGKDFAGNIPHSQNNAGDLDRQIFRATFDEFEEVDKRTPLKDGRRNQLLWSAVTENQSIRLAYPYAATVSMNISTEEFQNLPTRAYLVRGRKVKVPKNAEDNIREDGSLQFIGTFNGLLSKKEYFTTCPVCVFHDLLTNKRYGAGHFIDKTNLSWVDLYPLCQYANELITLADGTKEPRFACNVQVSSQAEAFTVLQDFASIFRGMMYWQSNTIQVTADHGNLRNDDGSIDPVAPVHIFSNSNVIGGVFNYSGSSLKTRSTSIRIRYSDPDNLYKPNVICIEDADLISKYGYQVKEVLAFGCTSKTQAQRMGRWMMKSEELDANTVTFAVGLDGALVFPGQVFAIQDELRAQTRLSGRISSSTTTSIVADQSITLPAGGNPTLTCVLRNGTVKSKEIDTDNTSGTTVTIRTDQENTAFSSEPLVGAVYSISTDSVQEQKFRCLSVADNGDGTFAVVAVQFNDSIYDAADKDRGLEFDDITTVDERPPIPVI
jgi:predicted phage tail protein